MNESSRPEDGPAEPDRDPTEALEAATAAKDTLVRELERRTRVEREFVTNAAHELRTPLASIIAAVEVLEAGAKENPGERDRFLRHISANCERLHRLIYALLVLARAEMSQEPLVVEEIEVGPLLEHAATIHSVAPDVELTVHSEPSVVAHTNRQLLEQAVDNVVGNATKFAARGAIALSAQANGPDSVRIEIDDTGPGMDETQRRRAFERFYRADDRSPGFGLGLSIARQAVEVLGGAIEIESEVGRGTRVVIIVPAGSP